MAVRAKREYLTSFRRSIEQRIVQPEQVRLNAADLSTIETLVQELAQPDADRVVYAIDVLESLDKRNLITPLLLYHESPKVRARALRVAGRVAQRDRPAAGRRTSGGCSPIPTPPSRAGAIAALGAISNEDAASLARPMLADDDPRIRATAAAALADQHARRRTSTSPKRRWPASSPTPRTARGRRGATSPSPSGRPRTRASAGCSSRSSTIPRRTSPTRRWTACAPRARTTSCSCRR